jgi:SAM-dependent methyltransferase
MIRIAKAKPAPPSLRFQLAGARELPEGGPFDAICAFNVLHLVDDLPGLLHRLRRGLAPDGLLLCKTWCFGDLPLRFRLLFRALRLVGLFPPARLLTQADLHQTLQAAGFAVEATRVVGARAQNPCVVARATETPRGDVSLPKSESPLP